MNVYTVYTCSIILPIGYMHREEENKLIFKLGVSNLFGPQGKNGSKQEVPENFKPGIQLFKFCGSLKKKIIIFYPNKCINYILL